MPLPSQELASFGFGLARAAALTCTVTRSPSIIEAYAGVTAHFTDFDRQHAAWEGQQVALGCFRGHTWTPAAPPRDVRSKLGSP